MITSFQQSDAILNTMWLHQVVAIWLLSYGSWSAFDSLFLLSYIFMINNIIIDQSSSEEEELEEDYEDDQFEQEPSKEDDFFKIEGFEDEEDGGDNG